MQFGGLAKTRRLVTWFRLIESSRYREDIILKVKSGSGKGSRINMHNVKIERV